MEGRAFWISTGILSAALLAQGAPASTGTRSSAFEYDPTTGLLTKVVVEGEDSNLCLVTTHTYDAYGNRTGTTTRNCNGSTANEAAAPTGDAVFSSRTVGTGYASGTGYPAGQFPTSNTDAMGNPPETRTYDARFGVVLTRTDPNNVPVTQTYDDFGRPVLKTNADGTKVQLSYAFCSGVNGGTASCPTYGAYVVTTQPLASDGVTANGHGQRSITTP